MSSSVPLVCMFMLLLHQHNHNVFFFPSLFCCQGDAKIGALSKQLNNQEDKQAQPNGEFELGGGVINCDMCGDESEENNHTHRAKGNLTPDKSATVHILCCSALQRCTRTKTFN